MIFYFSATGNSYHAANRLQNVFSGAVYNIGDCLDHMDFNFQLEKNEKLIFVFPLYFWGIPTIVEAFLKQVTFYPEEEINVIMTCGGTIGGADRYFSKLLKKKGFRIIKIYELVMETNYIILHTVDEIEIQQFKLKRAEETLGNIIESIKNQGESYHSSSWMGCKSKIIYQLYLHGRNTKYFYTSDRCISCGKCERECPIHIIKMQQNKPKWIQKKCVHCLRCLSNCPTGAIEYGRWTIGKERYHYPQSME